MIKHYEKCFCDRPGQLSESGREVIADLCRTFNVMNPHEVGRNDTELIVHHGQQEVITHIFRSVNFEHERVLREQIEEEKKTSE